MLTNHPRAVRLGPSASQVPAQLSQENAELKGRVRELERMLAIKNALDLPPAKRMAALNDDPSKPAGVKTDPPKEPSRPSALKSRPPKEPSMPAPKPDPALDGEELTEGEEEEAVEDDVEVDPGKPAESKVPQKINSSTHKVEYNRLDRLMQSHAASWPSMSKLWSGSNKDLHRPPNMSSWVVAIGWYVEWGDGFFPLILLL